jgi:WD40 repeat protein
LPKRHYSINSPHDQAAWWSHPYGNGLGAMNISPDRSVLSIEHKIGKGDQWDYRAEVIDLSRHKVLFERPDSVSITAIANGGRLIAIKDGPHARSIIDTSSQRELCHPRSEQPISAMAFSFDDHTLATGDAIGQVLLWNLATGNLIARLEADGTPIADLRFSADGRKLMAITEHDMNSDEQITTSTCRFFIWKGSDGP